MACWPRKHTIVVNLLWGPTYIYSVGALFFASAKLGFDVGFVRCSAVLRIYVKGDLEFRIFRFR